VSECVCVCVCVCAACCTPCDLLWAGVLGDAGEGTVGIADVLRKLDRKLDQQDRKLDQQAVVLNKLVIPGHSDSGSLSMALRGSRALAECIKIEFETRLVILSFSRNL
jgi:hypothetical protein